MLLVSLHGLIIPIVTVASYSPTNAPQSLDSVHTPSDQKLINSVRSGLSSGIRERIGDKIEDKIGDKIEDRIGVGSGVGSGTQLGSKHFPISPPTCISCDPLGEDGSDEGWMRPGEKVPWMRSGDEEPWIRPRDEMAWMRSGEEVAEHRCPEWASAPPSLDEAGDGKCLYSTKIRIRCHRLHCHKILVLHQSDPIKTSLLHYNQDQSDQSL